MQVGTTKKIGTKSYIFTGEGKNLHECLMDLRKFSFGDVKVCGICGGDKLYLDAYETKEEGYKYSVVRCADTECNGVLTFGVPKSDTETSYLRKNDDGKLEWREFVKKEE